jgi:hypothetical protein
LVTPAVMAFRCAHPGPGGGTGGTAQRAPRTPASHAAATAGAWPRPEAAPKTLPPSTGTRRSLGGSTPSVSEPLPTLCGHPGPEWHPDPIIKRHPAGAGHAARPIRHSQLTTCADVSANPARKSCFAPGRTQISTPSDGSGTPKGSLSPFTTSVGNPVASSSARERSGRPGGCNGNASARIAAAPTACALRHATRAPLERPPTINGNRLRAPLCNPFTTAIQASSRAAAGAGARLPATRYG